MMKNNGGTCGAKISRCKGAGTNMIRIALFDDDSVFMEQTRILIFEILRKNNVGANVQTFLDGDQASQEILATLDICFLDIDFAGKATSGVDIARRIRLVRQDSILIFLTNYIEYAPEGYEVQAFRYLLKSEVPRKLEKYLLEGISHLQERKETIHIRLSGETITLLLQQILYIESQKHAAIIFVQEDSGEIRQYRLFASLSSLEDQLSSRGFLRIQKSYLVNMRRIQRLRCDEATLDNGMLLPVSEKNYSQLKMKYLLWKGQQ